MSVTAAFTEHSSRLSRVREAELVAAFQQGDNRSFDILFGTYRPWLLSLVRKKNVPENDVEDVLQNVGVRCFRSLPGFRSESGFYTWAYRVTLNEINNYFNSKGRKNGRYETFSYDQSEKLAHEIFNGSYIDTGDPAGIIAAEETNETIMRALNKLPENWKRPLMLREFFGHSYEEIANITETPIGTIRSCIFRAREQIDREIKKMERPGIVPSRARAVEATESAEAEPPPHLYG